MTVRITIRMTVDGYADRARARCGVRAPRARERAVAGDGWMDVDDARAQIRRRYIADGMVRYLRGYRRMVSDDSTRRSVWDCASQLEFVQRWCVTRAMTVRASVDQYAICDTDSS